MLSGRRQIVKKSLGFGLTDLVVVSEWQLCRNRFCQPWSRNARKLPTRTWSSLSEVIDVIVSKGLGVGLGLFLMGHCHVLDFAV